MEDALNDFLQYHARKSHEQGGAKTFLAVSDEPDGMILGFYSLSPASISYNRTSEVIKRNLARHDISVFRMGRLAVNLTVQGKGLGGQLLLSAGKRCLLAASEVGGVALLIDAKNDKVARWYQSYGAISLLDTPFHYYYLFQLLRLFLLKLVSFKL